MSDYIDIFEYIKPGYPFNIFMGGRGVGKTYSGLNGLINRSLDTNRKFIYSRRIQTQIDIALDNKYMGEGANPFKKLNEDFGYDYGLHRINKNLCGIFPRSTGSKGEKLIDGEKIGYAVALSTVSSISGIDMSDVDFWLHDEFCPRITEQPIREEYDAFLNAYETFNRNREFEGGDPIITLLCSNSTNIYNPIIKGLGIVSDLEKMVKRNQNCKYYPKRGLAIHLLESPENFIKKKADTAIMRLAGNGRFRDMALFNKFAYNDFSLVARRPLCEYRPKVQIGNCCVYQHKSKNEAYVCYGNIPWSGLDPKIEWQLTSFKQKYALWLSDLYVNGRIWFESYDLKEDLLNYIL